MAGIQGGGRGSPSGALRTCKPHVYSHVPITSRLGNLTPASSLRPATMTTKSGVPDTWDDDWVNAANPPPTADAALPAKFTKSQKRAQHQDLQKQLWDSAENPTRMHWLETQGVVPLKQEIRPQVQLLSRKPQPTTAKRDGVAGLSIDDGDDSEEEARKKQVAAMEERTKQAKVEREEKQRKYAEARERIMGSSSPATAASRESSQGRDGRKPGRGGSRINGTRNSQPSSAAHSPTRSAYPGTGLFDPEDMGRRIPKPSTPNPDAPARQPRAPPSDHQIRGGSGFAGRGGKASV
ncbi:hypothetical protein LTR53_003098 [Teratosphaeriaceae sp. CCFEE 6253]|nr:hypothetical protein LTR53_003098 [Teratosphaeriaceae sp. CCFEE 6253]